MGCIHSKKDLTDLNRNIYRVVNVDADGVALWNGQLEISPRELILHRKGKELTTWSLQHLRRYGFDGDIFTFEAGRRCTTGEGIFAFRCRRAESLFHTLQTYIEGIATNDGITEHVGEFNISSMNGPSNTIVQPRVNRQSLTNSRPSSIPQSGQQGSSANYVIPNNRPQSMSPNGSVHIPNQSRSIDALATESNYLEPTPLRSNLGTRYASGARLGSINSGPLSPEPNSPSSPNSITNILEVTQLNQQQQYQNSNLYQEFPLRSAENNNNLLSKKLSLDIPPQEQAPSVCTSQQQKIVQPLQNIVNNSTEETHMSPHQTVVSPTDNDPSHMYVNVTPGELDSLVSTTGTPPVPTGGQTNFGFNRFPTQYSIDASTRCYENLEALEMRPIFARVRHSKPDIFAKVDLPITSQTPPISLVDKSEPATPTTTKITLENHKVNYIVLDLDQSPSSTTNATTPATAFTTTSTNTNQTDVVDVGGANSVKVQSPTLITASSNNNGCISQQTKLPCVTTQSTSNPIVSASSVTVANNITTNNISFLKPSTTAPVTTSASIGGTIIPSEYATIDFDKTVALSNSIAPSSEIDSEGSRKTRHSSTAARHSNSISD